MGLPRPYNPTMSWFQKLCRNTGLMIHGVTQPIKDDAKAKPTTKVVKHQVEEEERDGVTLRRTTIEEIEMKPRGRNEERGASNEDSEDKP